MRLLPFHWNYCLLAQNEPRSVQGEVNADGSAALDVARWAARIAEDAVSSAHAAVKQGDVVNALAISLSRRCDMTDSPIA
jgi:hypothetical protein